MLSARLATIVAQEPGLLDRAAATLTALGVPHRSIAEGEDEPALEVPQALVEPPPAEPGLIRIWSSGHGSVASRSASNPFAGPPAKAWLGASPELDPGVVKSTLEQAATGAFLTLPLLLDRDATIVSALERDSAAKPQHMERLREFCEHGNVADFIREGLETTLEELFTNAIYNAPIDDEGEPLFASCRRSETVTSPRPTLIRFGIDSSRVAVSVRDHYGSLQLARVMACLKRCYQEGGAEFEEKRGGAGLGFFFLLQQASRLVININPGIFTEVVVVRELGQRRAAFRRACPTVNMCGPGNNAEHHNVRSCYRMPVSCPAELIEGSETFSAVVLDVSTLGAFVEPLRLPHQYAVGDSLELEVFGALGVQPVHIKAVVRWVGKSQRHQRFGLGVEFAAPLSPDALATLC